MQDALVTKAADNIRILSAAMVQKAKSGHPGGAMGAADAITLLYSEFLRFDPENPYWEARDRFFMDPGHMSALLYGELAMLGNLSMDDLKNFRQLGSRTPGHPEVDVALGIENSSGPLGIGHAVALGNAIAERFMVERFGDILQHKVVCLVSDGGLEEEIAYGVGRIAGHLKLSNLIFFYDANQVQLSCKVEDVMSHDLAGQYEAWGFRVIDVADGHNIAELRKAFKAAWAETEKPTIIIGHTNRCTVLRGCLAHHKHTDAILRQCSEDTAVHANHTHHRKTADGNQTRVVDGRDTLDGTSIIISLCQVRDDGAFVFRTESILNQNWNILDAHRVNRRRIYHLRTEVAELCCLYV